ncbi:hypothetical protein [Micromonospora siamensis]|uniref:hypothetical protein n=1 Tax=Micromonospora siamensis TaxID=299152 RepID=UPI000B5ACF2F|nr:hypothetical protein [Micromonospora siamensis]
MSRSSSALTRHWQRGDEAAGSGRLGRFAWYLIVVSLLIIGLKPLLDIPGKKVPYDTVDAGMIATTIGAGLMGLALLLLFVVHRGVPARLLPVVVALVGLGLLSVVDLLLVPARDGFLQQFEVDGLRDIFGSYVPPTKGTITQAAQLVVGFAPVALLVAMVFTPHWFPAERIRQVLLLVLLGTAVHCLIAWLQVAGVVPYTFFFKLPGGNIGRASGGYFHPASLGRLLIFGVFLIYAVGARLRFRLPARLGLIVLLVGTTFVTTHRLTLLCVGLVIAAMELRRLPQLLAWLRGLPLRVAVPGAVLVLAAVVVLLVIWGDFLWRRVAFLLTQVGSLDVTDKDFMRGRGEIWAAIADAWGHAPLDVWLYGLGYEPWNTHSDPVRIFVVWGLFGVVLMSVLFVTLWRATRPLLDAEGRWALGVLYVATAFFALTQKPTSYSYYMWLFLFAHLLLVVVRPRRVEPAGAGHGTTPHDPDRPPTPPPTRPGPVRTAPGVYRSEGY